MNKIKNLPSTLASMLVATPSREPIVLPTRAHQKVQQQQTSLQAQAQGDHAFCNVNADAAAHTFLMNRGFAAAIVRNGAGDYTLTMDAEQNLTAQGLLSATVIEGSAVASMISVVPVGVTGVRVRTWSLTIAAPPVITAADLDFSLRVTPVAPA